MHRLKALGGLLVGLFFAAIGAMGLFGGRFVGLKSHRMIEGTPGRVLGGIVLAIALFGVILEIRSLIRGPRDPTGPEPSP